MKKLILTTVLAVAHVAAHAQETGDSLTAPYRLDEVVVTGTRQPASMRHLPVSLTVIDSQTLRADHRQSLLPTVMEQVPGLLVTSRGMMGYGVSTGGSGGMLLRGVSSAAGQMMVLVNGHPQYNGIYGHSIADSYQTMMAEKVEVMRGPASLLYGSNAMGGVMNIVTRSMRHDGHRTDLSLGAGSYGTVEAEASHQLKRGRLSTTVAGQWGRSDNHRPDTGFMQYGGYMDVGYDLSAHWRLFANADVTHFAAEHPGTVARPLREAKQWITRGVVSAGIDNHYGNTNGSLSIYNNFGRHKINDGYAADGGSPQSRLFRSRDALAGINWYQSVTPWRGGQLTAGIDYQHIYGRAYYTDRETGEVLDTPNKQSAHVHNSEVAIYADMRQEVLSWLTVEAGMRYDRHSVTGGEWIPQGGLVVRTPANGELKAMVGKGFRNPTMREMYLYPPSNEELEPERMMNYELAWHQQLWQNRLDYSINLFYLKADNIIQTVNRQNVNTGSLENQGVEIEARYRAGSHLTIATNHSYLHQCHPVAGAPTYKGYAGASWHQGPWGLHGGLTLVSGLYTEAGKEAPQENFTLVSLTIDYHLSHHIGLWLRGDNLLGQQYEINAGYPMPKATCMGGIRLHL